MYAMHACMHVCMCVMDVTYLMQCDAYMHVGIQALRSLWFEVHCGLNARVTYKLRIRLRKY